LLAQHDAEIGEIDGIASILLERQSNEIERDVMAAALMGENAKEMQRVGMIGFDREDLLIVRLGLNGTAGLMMRNTGFQEFERARIARFLLEAALLLRIGAALMPIHVQNSAKEYRRRRMPALTRKITWAKAA
jgi:hypothetical protein